MKTIVRVFPKKLTELSAQQEHNYLITSPAKPHQFLTKEIEIRIGYLLRF